jgi:hypothetical protein
MRIQLLQTDNAGLTRGRSGIRPGTAVVVLTALGLLAPVHTASSQTVDSGSAAVPTSIVIAAQRHRAPSSGKDVLVDAPAVRTPARTAPQATRVAAKHREAAGSKPMPRTALAYLESSRQALGPPPVAMVCLECDPAPGRNSSIIDGATIVVED